MFSSNKLKKIKNLRHCFFSRKEGVSKGIYESLNCGHKSKDEKRNVLKNLFIFQASTLEGKMHGEGPEDEYILL